MGAHQSTRTLSHVWLTPPALLEALGVFDLDPCAAPPPRPWDTAREMYALPQDGLALPWHGRVWLNPPYGVPQSIGPWMRRMAAHGCGVALIFARTETGMFFRDVWERATGLLFLRGRLNFHRPSGVRALRNAGAPSVLVSYGEDDRDVLAGAPIDGQFVPLRVSRSFLVGTLSATWRDVVEAVVRDCDGPVSLADLYRALSTHPKAKGNPHWQAKVRQTLQQGPFRAVSRGVWVAA
jgi:hypothetical protein